MKKLLSVLLSFSILVSSVSPSCAQLIRFLSTSTKTSEEATALAARNAARMTRVAANHEIALIPWKHINIYQVPEGYQFAFGGKKLADVLPTLVQPQGVKDVSANVLPSVNASMQPELGRRLEGAIQEQLVSQINSRQELLSKFDSQTLSNFSPDQIPVSPAKVRSAPPARDHRSRRRLQTDRRSTGSTANSVTAERPPLRPKFLLRSPAPHLTGDQAPNQTWLCSCT